MNKQRQRLIGFSLICSTILFTGCGTPGATGRSSSDVAHAGNALDVVGDNRAVVRETPNYLEVTRSYYVPSYREVLVYTQPMNDAAAQNRYQENILDIRSIDGVVNFATCQYPTKDVRRVRVVLNDSREVMNIPVSADIGNPRSENTNMNRPRVSTENEARTGANAAGGSVVGGNAAGGTARTGRGVSNDVAPGVAGRAGTGAVASRATTVMSTVESTYATPVSGWVSYHSSPSLSSPVIGRLQLGDRAPILGQSNAYWYEIQVNGRVAYITTNHSYVRVVDGGGPTAPPVHTGTNQPTPGTGTQSGTGKPPAGGTSVGGGATGSGAGSGGTATSGAAGGGSVASTGIAIPPPGVRIDANIRPIAGVNASATAKFNAILQVAQSKLGTPYMWGHNEDRGQTGFDCSNYAEYVYHHALGYSFTTASRTQYATVGVQDPTASMRPGDLLCFNQGGHSGIYVGNGQMIQCGGGLAKVGYLPISPGSYWYTHLSAVKHMF